MARFRIEVCLISARGLRQSSFFWRPQWYAVGWIDPDKKYCSKIDNSGSSSPSWRTKFSAFFDESDPNLDMEGLQLIVEVYRREPVFLREKLHGTAALLLKEFIVKFRRRPEGGVSSPEVGSFQLRDRKTGKVRGFVDVSIWISEESEDGRFSCLGNDVGGFILSDQKPMFPSCGEGDTLPSYENRPYPMQVSQPENNNNRLPHTFPSSHAPASFQFHGSHGNPSADTAGPSSHQPPPATRPPPPPPPPPSNIGFIPTFLPVTGELPPAHYINLPPSNAAGSGGPVQGRAGPGFGAGIGAGALAAGAVIFGDDFLSGLNFPTGFQGGSLSISADPPF